MNILLTGATGTLGKAILCHVLKNNENVKRIAAFARSESRLASLTQEYASHDAFRPFLGDVRDYERLRDACVGMDVVIHAAALKRVDDGAYNPLEMHKTNVVGSLNVANAARAEGVKKVILISSDKAVAAINTYGGSKYQAENCLRELNTHSAPRGTLISCVRYGNVLASTGSVLTIWEGQRKRHERICVTDATMSRFWLTIGEAVDHIFKTIAIMRGGEIVIPVLRSATLDDLVRAYMSLFGDTFVPYDKHIRSSGVRLGGEKYHESLLNDDEIGRAIATKGLIVVPPALHSWTTQEWETDHSVVIPLSYTSNFRDCLSYTQKELRSLLEQVLPSING
jgi:UDP-N-acetylglucosamine 4,6-dehydratase